MSVLAALNNLIPYEWDYVLRKHKVLTVYKEYLYDKIPYKFRNQKYYKKSIELLKISISKGFIYSVDFFNTREGIDFWKKIESEINNYIEQCR